MLMKKSTALLLSILFCGMHYGRATAADIDLVALISGKALLVVNGGSPKMYAPGSIIIDKTKLLAVDSQSVTVETNGKKAVLHLGQASYRSNSAGAANPTITLAADDRGHYLVNGQINGGSPMPMMIDTGASLVALPAAQAIKLGINYRNGKTSRSSTANGIVSTYLVRLDTLKIGDIELHQVDASVHEGELPIILLGMSALKRVTMLREGQQMVLTKKF
jgi:aspartyl protease family protein